MHPSLGEGVNSALEDAEVLGEAAAAAGGNAGAAAAGYNIRRFAEVQMTRLSFGQSA